MKLIPMLRENPELFRALREWLDAHQELVIKRCYTQEHLPDIYRAQGAAREISHIKTELEKQLRLKAA